MKNYPEGRLWAPSHTQQVFDPESFKALVKNTSKALGILKKKLKFNCLAATGNSGNLLAGALSYKLGLPLLIVRKNNDHCHDDLKVNGFRPDEVVRYLIIDDLVSSGNTVRRIMDQIKAAGERERAEVSYENSPIPECVGILLYDSHQAPWAWDNRYNDAEKANTGPWVYSVSHVIKPQPVAKTDQLAIYTGQDLNVIIAGC
jgi:hypoxanthine phosphoribosyltransferase